MDLPPETDEFIRESIESSLGLQISAKNMQMKLLASEDARHRLQDQIFVLEERLRESERRLEQFRAEASMNAQALRRSIEEKEMIASGYNESINNCAKLERECSLYERDLERVMESYDELAKENDELRARLQDNSAVSAAAPNFLNKVRMFYASLFLMSIRGDQNLLTSLAAEVESLQREKEQVRINLNRAEAEVKVLFDENKILDEENKRLLGLLKRERHLMGSEGKRSPALQLNVKDSSPTGRALDFGSADSSRQPLSPLHQNTPDSRMHKK
uniref:Uncharacterized protein n=1 Tax=Ananas comosus var. bracteatus TaxID=296719 RepID=A0A6V7PIL4_ANACO|nr:unnamed protein product [Ananas comosus var. bracteatus]